MFSSRLRQPAGRNRLALALERRRSAGLPIADLTLSNPTRAGFAYPASLLEPLAQARAYCYEPEPFGLRPARQAVADDFVRRGMEVPWNRIVLTASTSEAYSLLFKLLCDPGDTVLAPRPSYPLVEHLTELDGVLLDHYTLESHGRWAIDVHGMREKLSTPAGKRIRAIVMINPNNPTGSVVTDAELEAIAALADEHQVALIADEVFADYPISGPLPASVLRQQTALTFALGGLSKSVGLPQLKLGWIAIGGPPGLVAAAMERLEIISDAYLSVSTPVQVAARQLLEGGAAVRGQIQRRVRDNFACLCDLVSTCPACSVLPVDAGWYAVLQVPAVTSEEMIVLDVLDRTGVLVHPGYFFDFEREAFLVVSLLSESAVFADAMATLLGEVGFDPRADKGGRPL
jgi:aspartate/methionine/tyrosine aminotransferase